MSQGPTEKVTGGLLEEIKALNEEGMKLFHNHDIDALMTCYVPDATFMPPGMDVVRGKDAIAQQIAHFFDLGAADMKLETEEVGPLGEAGEMVYERGHEAITHEDGHLVFNGKYLALWKKVDGRWLIYSRIFNSNDKM